jgi:signal transduction histidine kinase
MLARGTLESLDSRDARAIQTQAYRLDAFLNDMLILAKLESERLMLNRSMVDINQMVEQVKESYCVVALSKNVELTTDLPPAGEHVLLDANLFQRVLENLVSNALKFSSRESQVTLQVEYPRAKTLLYASVPRVRIKVFDQGPGISEEDRERVFDKFEIVKLKEEGDPQIGLGLAFCKMVVEAHSGQINVEPNSPQGSVFVVEV